MGDSNNTDGLLPTKINAFLLLFAIFLGIASFLTFPPYSGDDCYITYRYAYNLYHHKQFTFNLDERILSTTTPLYTLILAGCMFFSDNLPMASHLISFVSASLAGFLVFLIFKKQNPLLGIFCLISFPFMLRDIGLEINFLIFLFMLSTHLFVRERYLLCSVVLALCFLTRQDSAVFILCVTIMFALRTKKFPWKELAVFIIFIIPWFVFCYFYFGSFLPSSLQAKIGFIGFWHYFVSAFWYLAHYCDAYNFHLLSFLSKKIPIFLPFDIKFAQMVYLIGLYCIVIIGGIAFGIKHLKKDNYTGILFYLYPSLMIIVLCFIAPPPEHRWHLTSAIIFALIGQLHLITTPILSLTRHKPSPPLIRKILSICAIMLVSCYLLYFVRLNVNSFYSMVTTADKSFWFGARFDCYKKLGLFLRDNVLDGEKVYALEVGTIGYFSQKRMIDGSGLISPGYDIYHRKGCWLMINDGKPAPFRYEGIQKGCWLMGIENEFPEYVVADDMAIPYYEPIFYAEDALGKKVVYRKAQNLPEDGYPIPELMLNWVQFMLRKYGKRDLADWLSSTSTLM